MCKTLRQADCRDRLAFSGSGGGGRRDQDDLAAPLERGIGEELKPDFAAVRPNLLEGSFREFELAGYRLNRKKSVCHESCGAIGRQRILSAGKKIITNSGAKSDCARQVLLCKTTLLIGGIQAQLLDAPIEQLRDEKLVLTRSEEHTSELQSRFDLVCRLLLEKKKKKKTTR